MSEVALDIQELRKSYQSGRRRLQVLNGATLTLARGEMAAIMGESGAGKSTLLHLVGGMERPDSGSIAYGRSQIGRLNPTQLASFRNRKVGFIFQFHHLLPEFTAVENVMFPLLLRRMPFKQARERSRRWLEEVGLFNRLEHKPGEMSGGEQQRVAIARALSGRPSVLLADEPTGNLDRGTAEVVHTLLVDLHRRHQLTSIIVTHNRALADLCQRRFMMIGGRLIEE